MENDKFIVGLDIGTTKICAVVGRKNEFGKLEVLGMGKAVSDGVIRGIVTNIDKTVNAIQKAVNDASDMAEVDIANVIVGIAGQHIRSTVHHGAIMRNPNQDEITIEDVRRLANDMENIVVPPGNTIIHVMPQDYTVDYEDGIKDPVGMSGSKLEADFHIITAQTTAINNINRCVKRADLLSRDLILEPLASSLSVLSEEDKEAGVCLVDIGGGTTDIAIFYDNIIRHTAVIPLGGNIITTDIKEALEWSDVIIMPVPAFAQENMFKRMMLHLRDGHIFTILPGNEASLIFAKMMREAGIKKDVTFCEAASIPYACRIVGPAKIFIGGLKDAFEFGVFPADRTAEAAKRMQAILPLQFDVKQNVIEVHFCNLNMIVHPSTATLNMGAFESRQGEFFFYKEGMSESTAKVQQKLDDERIAIGEKFGFKLESFVKLIKRWYHIEAKSIHEFAQVTPIHNAFGHDAPKSPKERYISEDTPFILVTLHEYGELAGVVHPAIRSIIDIDNIYNDTDYFVHGRTLASLGLAGMNIKDILAYVRTGEFKSGG